MCPMCLCVYFSFFYFGEYFKTPLLYFFQVIQMVILFHFQHKVKSVE